MTEVSEEPTTQSLNEAWDTLDSLPDRGGCLFHGEVVFAMALLLDRVSREREAQALERAAKLREALEIAVAVMVDLGACLDEDCPETNCRRGIVTARAALESSK